MLSILVSLMNLMLFWSHLINIQRRGDHLGGFNIGLQWGICTLISFKHGVLTDTTELYILKQISLTLTFIQATVVWESKHFLNDFLQISKSIWKKKISMWLQPAGLLKLIQNEFCTISFLFCVPSYISGVHHFGWNFCFCDCLLIQP